MHILRVVTLAVAAVTVAGCTASLRTAPPAADGCDQALIRGQLLPSAQSGLALRAGDGGVVEVLWPFGYTARRGVSGIELVGRKGEALAREGHVIEAAGGTGNDGVFVVCEGTVQVVPKPG